MFSEISQFISEYVTTLRMPDIRPADVIEILIISYLIYQLMVWIRKTRAWSLLKGIVVIMVFMFLAAVTNMTTILWIAEKLLTLIAIAVIIVLQPELRRALEEIGRKNILDVFMNFDFNKMEEGRFSDKTLDEIVKGCFEMGRARTGALIVMEKNSPLTEFEKTGIDVDAIVSSQLLINIFEHNTPLHDGAVIVRGNRIVAATCYLPLSDNRTLSKELGTRHRAGLGVSEVTDALTIIVSEETGKVSAAYNNELFRGLSAEELKGMMRQIQEKPSEEKRRTRSRKGRSRSEKKADK